jgi:hypothetical protein
MNETKIVPLSVSLVVSTKEGNPCIEIRRVTNDPELIKAIISCAFHDVPLVVQPTFSNHLRSIRSLIDKGVLFIDKKTGEYKFTF